MPFKWLRKGAIQLDSKLALHVIIVPRGCAQTEGRLFNLSLVSVKGIIFWDQGGNLKFVRSIPCKIALEGLKPKFSRASSEFSYSSTFSGSNNLYVNILSPDNCLILTIWTLT